MAVIDVEVEELSSMAASRSVTPVEGLVAPTDVLRVALTPDAAKGPALGLEDDPLGIGAVVVGIVAAPDHEAPTWCDVVVSDDDAVGRIAATVDANPVASLTLVSLLRRRAWTGVATGISLESGCYSALLAGSEFSRWRGGRPVRPTGEEVDPVRIVRDGDVVELTLDRPRRRNAFNAAMRDALVEYFSLVRLDDSIREVHLRGEGEGFCSGGDLDEFGTTPDVGVAHLIRLRRNVGAAIHAVAERVVVHLHGACIGSGIELAAFAGTVLADETVTVALPELSMGLIPGAGGTVSLPRRIGGHRVAQLALTGESIDATTALEWGLVDEIR